MVVEAGESLGCRAVREQEAMDNVELPELHGRRTLPALPGLLATLPLRRVDDPSSHQRAINRRLRRCWLYTLASQLERKSTGSPVRLCAAHLEQLRLNGGRHLMRAVARPMGAVRQAIQSVCLIALEPDMDRLSGDVPIAGHLGHGPTLCDYCQDCFVPLLCHAYLPHGRECQASAGTPVRHQPNH